MGDHESDGMLDYASETSDALPGLLWKTLSDCASEFVNRCWRDYTDVRRVQASVLGLRRAIHPVDDGLPGGSLHPFLDALPTQVVCVTPDLQLEFVNRAILNATFILLYPARYCAQVASRHEKSRAVTGTKP
jgi:hypothetical protein